MANNPLSVRVPPEVAAKLEKLAESTDRSKSWHIEQALQEYLRIQEWQLAGIEEGLASIAAGKSIDHAVVMRKARAHARKLDAQRRRKAG